MIKTEVKEEVVFFMNRNEVLGLKKNLKKHEREKEKERKQNKRNE